MDIWMASRGSFNTISDIFEQSETPARTDFFDLNEATGECDWMSGVCVSRSEREHKLSETAYHSLLLARTLVVPLKKFPGPSG